MRRALAAALLHPRPARRLGAAGGADRGDRGGRRALHRRSAAQPAILDGYRVTRDLNGDGVDDFLTDLARLECGGAWSAFCGSSGCPVTAWLSEPGGGHARFELGRLLGLRAPRRRAAPRRSSPATPRPSAPATDVEDCTRTWTFASNSPETPPIDPPPEPRAAEPAAAPEPTPAEPRRRPPLRRSGGRRLDAAPGAGVEPGGARHGGVGNIASLAAFCLSGEPFLAVTFHERPEAEGAALGFAFSDGAVRRPPATRRPRAAPSSSRWRTARSPRGWRAATARSRSASTAPPEGTLSLAGSTRAIRGALEGCGGP